MSKSTESESIRKLRVISTHTRVWLMFLNIISVITVVFALYPNIANIFIQNFPIGEFIWLDYTIVAVNILYFLLTNASEVFVIQPTFFKGIPEKTGQSKLYEFTLNSYLVDKFTFNATIEYVILLSFSEIYLCSVLKENGNENSFYELKNKGDKKTFYVPINRHVKKGFFLKFALKPDKDLDYISDIDAFLNSLNIEIRVLYRKYKIPFELRKRIP